MFRWCLSCGSKEAFDNTNIFKFPCVVIFRSGGFGGLWLFVFVFVLDFLFLSNLIELECPFPR